MKKRLIQFSLVFAMVTSLVFTSCRKKDDATPATTTNDQTIQANDQARVSDATNSVTDDVDAVATSASYGGRMEGIACDLKITTSSDSLTKSITYSGQCSGAKYTRSGTLTLTLVPASVGKKWADAGSKIIATYQNVVVTKLNDGKSVTLNGTITHTNVTGGTKYNTKGLSSISHRVKGVLTAKFSDSLASTATWYITKLRQWNSSAPKSITIMGDSSNLLYTNIGESGINRKGKPFVVTSPNGVTVTNCGTESAPYFRALGEVNHHFNAGTMSLKYGSDASGNLASDACSGEGYYINWTNNLGVDKYTAFISY